jgi:predicted nucleic acid-binding protein
MKAYWDSSALIETRLDADLRARLKAEGGVTRTHSLAETFSTLSGNPVLRVSANDAAATIKALAPHLEFVDLTADEVIAGLDRAQSAGVRGGRVHDFLHALAAKKAGSKSLLTLDKNDFHGLVTGLSVEQV